MVLRKDYFLNDRFAKLIGAELLEIGEGCAKAQLIIGPEHLNAHGTVHGGVLFSLADFAFAAACSSYGSAALLVQASMNFLRTAKEGLLTAEAREISRGRKIGNYQVTVTAENGEVLAVFSGVSYSKGIEIQ